MRSTRLTPRKAWPILVGIILLWSPPARANFGVAWIDPILTEYPLLKSWIGRREKLWRAAIAANLASYALLFVWWLFSPLSSRFPFLEDPLLPTARCPFCYLKQSLGLHEGNALAELIQEHFYGLFAVTLLLLGCWMAWTSSLERRETSETSETEHPLTEQELGHRAKSDVS
ncbi:MAG: hypothetical protein JXR96_27975 [Deltaproteobacteria bacterium]|nr:hypothetical protein [Deltaproteobacteria bacterium]